MSEAFYIEKLGNLTRFVNKTPLRCVIKIKPIPPKRKYVDCLIVKPDQFIMLEQGMEWDRIAITFDDPQIYEEEDKEEETYDKEWEE